MSTVSLQRCKQYSPDEIRERVVSGLRQIRFPLSDFKDRKVVLKPNFLMASDRDKASELVATRWGSEIVVALDTVYRPAELPGFVAVQAGQWVGLVTYHIRDQECEIVSLDSLRPGVGIGTALVDAVAQAALDTGCSRLWLVTTNDNLDALRFYQKRGFCLVAVHRGSVEHARALKPEIPLLGQGGIPIRDAIELELVLAGSP